MKEVFEIDGKIYDAEKFTGHYFLTSDGKKMSNKEVAEKYEEDRRLMGAMLIISNHCYDMRSNCEKCVFYNEGCVLLNSPISQWYLERHDMTERINKPTLEYMGKIEQGYGEDFDD